MTTIEQMTTDELREQKQLAEDLLTRINLRLGVNESLQTTESTRDLSNVFTPEQLHAGVSITPAFLRGLSDEQFAKVRDWVDGEYDDLVEEMAFLANVKALITLVGEERLAPSLPF